MELLGQVFRLNNIANALIGHNNNKLDWLHVDENFLSGPQNYYVVEIYSLRVYYFLQGPKPHLLQFLFKIRVLELAC